MAMRNTLLLFSILLLLASCKSKQPVSEKPFGKDPALENIRWQLTELNGRVPQGLPPGKSIDLVFEGTANTFTGFAGCNQCNGMYTTQDDLIKLQVMALTKMACDDMQSEQSWLQVLEQADHYTLEKKKEKGQDVQYLLLKKDDQLLAKLRGVKD